MPELPTESEPVRVIQGDCRTVLPTLPAGSVDCVFADPPYPCIDRSYGRWTEAEWFALMDVVVPECRRVLKPTGSAVFVLQPNSERVGRMRTWWLRFMLKWAEEWGMVQDVWWWNFTAMPTVHTCRANGLTRPSVKPCVWLGEASCYRSQDAVLWSQSDANAAVDRSKRALQYYPSGLKKRRGRQAAAADERGGVTPFNLIPVANTVSNGDQSAGCHGHGAGTPLVLTSWWVRYICPPGGTVLDPFAGSGTTAVACLLEGRRCIAVEKEPAYVDIIRRRVAEAMQTDGLFAGFA